jgi:hypothetical protein
MTKNPLDLLFRDIQRDIERDLAAEARKPRSQQPWQSQYANPDNWTLGKVVCLIHATEGALGVYQEYFHKRSPSARRLLPANLHAPVDRNELVFGDHWLHPAFRAPETDSEQEIRAITARFNELMSLEDDEEVV